MKNFCKWILPAMIMAILAAGCATTVQYGDETSSKPISTDFGSSDLQQVAAKMVDSLLSDPLLDDISVGGPPLLIVDKVKNKTMQHIDTESITDSIRTKLIRSRKFSFQAGPRKPRCRKSWLISRWPRMTPSPAASRTPRVIC